MNAADQDGDKPFEPTPEKLRKARERGEVARSTDLSVLAAYSGLILSILALGQAATAKFGTGLLVLLDQPDRLAPLVFEGAPAAPIGGLLGTLATALAPIFGIPALAVLLVVLAQRAFVVTPKKARPKLSRISLISNARNKFGRSGLFEFAKSSAKLVAYSAGLAAFLHAHLTDIVAASAAEAAIAISYMTDLVLRFMVAVFLISVAIGAIDFLWQKSEYLRKNRMSHKEIADETKEAEGDPQMKSQRRRRGQEIASSRMMSDVPSADVVVVNPTHFAVALKWSRKPGAAPVCVAKGVDELAANIRHVAAEAGVPIHSDPPTARALHASTAIGDEIDPTHYQAVAAAIRFAETMRRKARERPF